MPSAGRLGAALKGARFGCREGAEACTAPETHSGREPSPRCAGEVVADSAAVLGTAAVAAAVTVAVSAAPLVALKAAGFSAAGPVAESTAAVIMSKVAVSGSAAGAKAYAVVQSYSMAPSALTTLGAAVFVGYTGYKAYPVVSKWRQG